MTVPQHDLLPMRWALTTAPGNAGSATPNFADFYQDRQRVRGVVYAAPAPGAPPPRPPEPRMARRPCRATCR